MNMTYDKAWEIVGGLSVPSKMPCHGWSVSALRCKVGSKLAKVANSVCAGCYALKGHYRYPAVKSAHERRWQALKDQAFVPSMVFLLRCLGNRYFRWYDSGDIDCAATLRKIVDIARQTPEVKHWLPTKEYGVVSAYLKAGNTFPPNLCVRLSSYMTDESGPIVLATRLGLTISEVRRKGYTCPSSSQGNKCADCRACWDRETFNVSYRKH